MVASRMPCRPWFKALLLLGSVLAAVQQAEAHGSMTVPRARNVVAPIDGQTWWKDHGNGAGLCGDPFQGYSGDPNYYLVRPGPSQATYTAGQTVNLQWWLQVNHGGRIGVKLCPRRDGVNQACFDQYPLFRSDFPSERFVYIMTGGQQFMSASFRLPAGVSCSGGCTLQWEYLTMNSCFEPCNRAVCGVYADLRNPVSGGSNMGSCCGGPACSTSIGEMFRNCADITINAGSGGTISPPPATPPPSTPTPPPATPPPTTSCTKIAAGGGACGGSTCCPSGQCCSKWGWCGISADHCGSGCQRGYGSCWASAARLARAARRSNTGTASVADATTADGAAPIALGNATAVSITDAVSSSATDAPAAAAGVAAAATDAAAAAAAAAAATEPVLPVVPASEPAAAAVVSAAAAAVLEEHAGGNSTIVPASAASEPVVQDELAATRLEASEAGAATAAAAAGNRRLLRV